MGKTWQGVYKGLQLLEHSNKATMSLSLYLGVCAQIVVGVAVCSLADQSFKYGQASFAINGFTIY